MIVKIIGGHGRVALLLSRYLSKRGDKVVSLFRDPAHEADIRATGADPVVFDIEKATQKDFEAHLKGSDAIVWSAGAGGKGGKERTDAVDHQAAVTSIQAARALGIKRYIMVSFLGSGPNHPYVGGHPLHNYAEAKAKADAFLENSSLDWTILKPGLLTFNEPSEKIWLNPPVEASNKGVSRANVALVAAAVLHAPNTVHKHIDFLDGDTPIKQAIESL